MYTKKETKRFHWNKRKRKTSNFYSDGGSITIRVVMRLLNEYNIFFILYNEDENIDITINIIGLILRLIY